MHLKINWFKWGLWHQNDTFKHLFRSIIKQFAQAFQSFGDYSNALHMRIIQNDTSCWKSNSIAYQGQALPLTKKISSFIADKSPSSSLTRAWSVLNFLRACVYWGSRTGTYIASYSRILVHREFCAHLYYTLRIVHCRPDSSQTGTAQASHTCTEA